MVSEMICHCSDMYYCVRVHFLIGYETLLVMLLLLDGAT